MFSSLFGTGVPANVVYLVFVLVCFAVLAGAKRFIRRYSVPVEDPEPLKVDRVEKYDIVPKLARKSSELFSPSDANEILQKYIDQPNGGNDGNSNEDNEDEEPSSQWSTNTAELLRLSSSESETEFKNSTKNSKFRSVKKRGSDKSFTQPKTAEKLSNVSNIVASNKDVQRNSSMDDRFTTWVTRDGGVRKFVETIGAGNCPQAKSTVKYFYKIAKNAQFKCPLLFAMDSPTKTKLDSSEIIAGLELGLMSMRAGEQAVFRIEPKYGYGIRKPDTMKISPKDVIFIQVELLEISETPSTVQRFLDTDCNLRLSKFSTKELADAGDHLHRMGREVFVQGHYSEASQYFREAVAAQQISAIHDEFPGLPSQRNSMLAQLQINIAVCCLKEGKWPEVVEHAQKALDIKADHASMAKACYLLAKAAHTEKELRTASDFVKRGLRLNPEHPELLNLSKICEIDAVQTEETSKKLFQKMMSGIGSSLPESEEKKEIFS